MSNMQHYNAPGYATRNTKYVILAGIILLAFFLRVWQLPQTPPGLWYDEAYYAMDAAWLTDGGPWQLFFVGNNGREPIWIYLQALFIWIFGATPLTARLIAPLAGTLTVPLMYVLARRLSRRAGWLSEWVALVAAFGLAVSFWHLGLSRGGYRGILLPLVTALLFYLFWRGWQEKSIKFVILAGLALGVSQYTYLAARALPLVFALFAATWTLLFWFSRDRNAGGWASTRFLWLSLVAMAGISMVLFAPLGWIFFNDPSLFSARTGDVFFTPETPAELAAHLSNAARLFVDAGDPNWRHHLPGRPMLGWLGWLGFFPGLIVCLRRWRHPAHLFLVIALFALYLPALLSVPPVHALRLSALLPVYYIIFALGLTELARWFSRSQLKKVPGNPHQNNSRISLTPDSQPLTPALSQVAAGLLIAVLLLESTLTVVDYFGRWANHEETYVEYNTPLVDFVEHVAGLAHELPVIIPFQIYVHPTTRYLLHDQFTEQPAPGTLNGPVQMVSLPDNFRMLNVANIPEMPAYAWLSRDENGAGVVYISRLPRGEEQAILREALAVEAQVYPDRFGRNLAYLRRVENAALLTPMFTETDPLRTLDLNWDDQAQLLGYDVVPAVIEANQPLTLNLYWRSLTGKTFDKRLFLQLVDTAGNPIYQWEGEAFREDMYRWRPDGILPTQHLLWVGPETPPGPYLIRIGFFNPETGERLPLHESANLRISGDELVDQVHLGLFYVAADDTDPRTPATPLSANFADAIQLAGVTLPQIQDSLLPTSYSLLHVTFHWQALRPTDKPYTVFLQLLNQNGEVVSGWDSQPFNGLYPTNRWSPGEQITDTFMLPLPENGLSPGAYRLISGFYDTNTGQRLSLTGGGDFAELGAFEVLPFSSP